MIKKLILTPTILFAISLSILGQDVREDFEEVINSNDFDANSEVVVHNINGSLEIVGADVDEIRVSGTKKLWNRRGSISNSEAEDYFIETVVREGNVYVYVQAPGTRIRWTEGRMRFSHSWENNSRDNIRFEFNLKVEVPRDLFVDASTVNGGKLTITGLENGMDASNVNGDVIAKEIIGVVDASTVNGDISVWFKESPTDNCEFETVNGKMEVYSPTDFGAVVTFKSLHGELYTDFDKITRLANQLNREETRDGYRYRINKTAPIQIGEGGPTMSFESVNGSAYIREIEL